MNNDLIFRLKERARIRRQIPTRRSVIDNVPDRLADLLEEAASEFNKISIWDSLEMTCITQGLGYSDYTHRHINDNCLNTKLSKKAYYMLSDVYAQDFEDYLHDVE